MRLRREKKFAINFGIYEILRGRCSAVLKRDKYTVGEDYRITSLYFDDMFRTSYYDKVNGFSGRKKYRIRVYNLSKERITLEGKFKEGEHAYKIKAPLTDEEYISLVNREFDFCGERKDLQYFYAYTQTANPKPAAIVDYLREAYIADAGNVRVTFDKNLSAGLGTADMFNAEFSPSFENKIILEVKYDEFLPSYIQDLFSGFSLREEPISKYVICANKFMEVEKRCFY
ncbi:MAG: polyphosphate polymerase domain-containing protein [Clostridiales bacterium]|jgi:hypothetical protein|nr:polyphosphate polymerase domain-containing protein [Clostridiales bacterium]